MVRSVLVAIPRTRDRPRSHGSPRPKRIRTDSRLTYNIIFFIVLCVFFFFFYNSANTRATGPSTCRDEHFVMYTHTHTVISSYNKYTYYTQQYGFYKRVSARSPRHMARAKLRRFLGWAARLPRAHRAEHILHTHTHTRGDDIVIHKTTSSMRAQRRYNILYRTRYIVLYTHCIIITIYIYIYVYGIRHGSTSRARASSVNLPPGTFTYTRRGGFRVLFLFFLFRVYFFFYLTTAPEFDTAPHVYVFLHVVRIIQGELIAFYCGELWRARATMCARGTLCAPVTRHCSRTHLKRIRFAKFIIFIRIVKKIVSVRVRVSVRDRRLNRNLQTYRTVLDYAFSILQLKSFDVHWCNREGWEICEIRITSKKSFVGGRKKWFGTIKFSVFRLVAYMLDTR